MLAVFLWCFWNCALPIFQMSLLQNLLSLYCTASMIYFLVIFSEFINIIYRLVSLIVAFTIVSEADCTEFAFTSVIIGDHGGLCAWEVWYDISVVVCMVLPLSLPTDTVRSTQTTRGWCRAGGHSNTRRTYFLKLFIEFIGVILVNKIIYTSDVQFYNTSLVYCIVCSPPKLESPSITIILSLPSPFFA